MQVSGNSFYLKYVWMYSDLQSFHFFSFLPGRSWGRFYGGTGIRIEPLRVEQVQREKVSPSLAEPSRSHRARGVFGGMAVPCVQSKADRTAEVVQGQSSRTSVLVRTLELQETKDTIPRGLNGQEIYWLKKLKNSAYRLQVKLDLGAQLCHSVSHLSASPCFGLTLEHTLLKWRQLQADTFLIPRPVEGKIHFSQFSFL